MKKSCSVLVGLLALHTTTVYADSSEANEDLEAAAEIIEEVELEPAAELAPAHEQVDAPEEDDAPVAQQDVKPRAKQRRHHLRMAAGLGAVMAAGYSWYWRDDGKPNEVDWQLGFGGDALTKKVTSTSGWRFDGNAYDINALGHPGFGVLTHVLARENGYTLAEAFLISTATSGAWELFVEWAEYGSLNDLALTSPVGIPVGETIHQMIHHARETNFEVRTGVGSENGATFAVASAAGDLDLIPTVGDGSFTGSRHVSFAVEVAADEAVRSIEGGAKTTLAGFYRNRTTSSVFAGLCSEFDYRKREDRPEREWDLLTTMSIGPTVDVKLRRRELTVAMGADVYLDFALVKSQAFAKWRAEHPTETIRNVMQTQEQPYYYAVGASVDPRVNVAYRGYRAGGKIAARMFDSIDGHDRDQEMVSSDVRFRDHEARAEAWMGYERRRMSVLVDGRVNQRGGSAGGVKADTFERTVIASLGYRL